jgi:hypothetical protein
MDVSAVPDRDRMETWQPAPTDAPIASSERTAEEVAEAMGLDLHDLAAALEVMSTEDRRAIKRVAKQARDLKALGHWERNQDSE